LLCHAAPARRDTAAVATAAAAVATAAAAVATAVAAVATAVAAVATAAAAVATAVAAVGNAVVPSSGDTARRRIWRQRLASPIGLVLLLSAMNE